MTKYDKTALRRYYRRIKGWLPCTGKEKRRIVSDVRSNVAALLEDEPEADFARIEQHFGTPQQIAAACVADMDMPALLQTLRARKRVVILVASVCLAGLLMWCCGICIAIADQHAANPGIIVDQML